ncbi:putative protease [Ereboglobus sp. PH5-10]|uniref:U32 family peptidase n=1 Tax=Ereboglobus sp. PH5-10 TaxID=2940629 RepID=UPI0024054173|nr:U32 family peptidase [Ereboglobus sp. PH5-10]MDF9826337.1 putative protease [Ereboglobus sp. PH5-10]
MVQNNDTPRRPEILAPAGDWECVRAAVENGADAVYFGLERFNARMRAKNFTQADLPALMAFLHTRGVRGYVTFNTLVFPGEIGEARDYARTIIAAGADAAIVQDVGACKLIREISPDFPIHASTQMTVTSAAGVAFARELGASLVVLARENTLADIEAIQAAQRASGHAPLSLEVFAHGALCVAYSGQCLTSEALGGRSANRGECAQACRLPYELICDDRKVDLGDRRYLLSPRDLAGIDVLPELARLGVASLKIEGRLKSPEYVASITRVYRAALDKLMENEKCIMENVGGDWQSGTAPHSKYELEMTFSRGLGTGWFRGIDNQNLVHARFGTKRGVFLGEVARVQNESATLRLAAPLKPGDGVVFDAGTPEIREEGGRVYQVDARPGGETTLRFGHGDINFGRVRPGQLLWKTNDPALDRELRATYDGDKIRHTRPVDAEVHGHADAPLTLILNDRAGHVVREDSAVALSPAQTQPLTESRLRDQIGRLGGTPYSLGKLASRIEGDVMLPMSELNRLRRAAVEKLTALRAAPKRWTIHNGSSGTGDSTVIRRIQHGRVARATQPAAAEIIPVLRNLSQLEAALTVPDIATVYCEFENPKHYREAVARVRDLGKPDLEIWVAPPRITKPGEEWILAQTRSANADGYIARNADHLRYFADDRKRGDFSLNVANQIAAEYFLAHHGLERVTASYDLNIAQLEALLQASNNAARALTPASYDITIHQRMPMFHMEHCVFCTFLSGGKDYRDCGRPCEKHRARLRDRTGAEFPLKADAGCRNTVFNNRAQTGAEYVARLLALGARHFRVEFVDETPGEVVQTLARYRQLLRGEIDGAALWRELKLLNQLGVTRGQMEAAPRILRRKN